MNDQALRRLRVTKERFIADGSGLYIRATPRGKRTFVYRSQAGGKSRWKVLGHYPRMSLLEARNRAAEAASRGFAALTVGEAYREYLPRIRQHYKWHEDIERRFRADILPAIGERKVDEVTRQEVSDLLQAIVRRGSRIAANRTLPDVRNFFAYCIERGWRNDSPVAGITRKSVGGKERAKPRNLSEAELLQLVGELVRDRFQLRTRLAMGLLLLTGARAGEVLGVNSNEISHFWWELPGNRTKNGRPHKIYLSPQARCLIYCAFRNFGSKPFKGMDHRTLSRAVARMKFPVPFSPHKFRHTMATRLTDMGVAPHITEKMLNHRLEGVFEVYNHAEFLPERRAAWRLWGVYLAKLRRRYANRVVRGGVVSAGRPGDASVCGALRPSRQPDCSVGPSNEPGRPLLHYKEDPWRTNP